jgi:hypothetical protein
MPKTNRWHPVMLPDDYLRKLKQDLAEAGMLKSAYETDPELTAFATLDGDDFITCEPDYEQLDESQSDDAPPI